MVLPRNTLTIDAPGKPWYCPRMMSRTRQIMSITAVTLLLPLAQTALANDSDRVNTLDWTLTLVINRHGALEEQLSQYPTRRTCYDAMFDRIQEAKRTPGHSAAGLCLKMFVGSTAQLTDADRLVPSSARVAQHSESAY